MHLLFYSLPSLNYYSIIYLYDKHWCIQSIQSKSIAAFFIRIKTKDHRSFQHVFIFFFVRFTDLNFNIFIIRLYSIHFDWESNVYQTVLTLYSYWIVTMKMIVSSVGKHSLSPLTSLIVTQQWLRIWSLRINNKKSWKANKQTKRKKMPMIDIDQKVSNNKHI